MKHKQRILIAGKNGLVSSALFEYLSKFEDYEVSSHGRSTVDFCVREDTFRLIEESKPDWILLSAAKVGGIQANQKNPFEFISSNIQIQTNLIDAACHFEVKNLIFFGSSCIYPLLSKQPISEEYFMSGKLEKTNQAYAAAKIAGVFHVNAIRQQFNLNYFSVMPSNLYGENDNYDLENAHVIPALVSKFINARKNSRNEVVIWGDGTPRREFLYVQDLTAAIEVLIRLGKSPYDIINIGPGYDLSITELVEKISVLTNFNGNLVWDKTKPNGTQEKLLDVTRIKNLGWKPKVDLDTGLARIVKHLELNSSEA